MSAEKLLKSISSYLKSTLSPGKVNQYIRLKVVQAYIEDIDEAIKLLAQPEPVYWENEKKALLNEIDHLTNRLAQPEQTEPVEICPDCGSKVTWYHCREGTRVVCGDKCQGYKVIASRGRRDECFTKGDL